MRFSTRFSTLKILATVKQGFGKGDCARGFSTLNILATVKPPVALRNVVAGF